MVEPYLHLNGRRMILTDETEVNIGNVVQILRKAYRTTGRTEARSATCGLTTRVDSRFLIV